MRIYWDQASLLKEIEVIGARGKNWPIRAGAEQVRLLKTASKETPPVAAQSTSQDQPPRSSSPTKRHIKDPYSADSLFDLISPTKGQSQQKEDVASGKRYSKDPYAANSLFDLVAPGNSHDAEQKESETPRPSSPGKRIVKDPYAANSLADLLSPANGDASVEEAPRPFARSAAQPPPRNLNEIFVEEEDAPATPSKPERVIAPKAGAGKFQGNRIFGDDQDEQPTQERASYQTDPRKFKHFDLADSEEPDNQGDRASYKTDPRKFNHFNIGDDDVEGETAAKPTKINPRHQSQWNFDEFNTPERPARHHAPPQAQFSFGYDEDEKETPPSRPAVVKPRRDADVHFEMVDDKGDGDDGRDISSYHNRGQRLYQNRLFDEAGEAEPSESEKKNHRPLSVVGHNANRQKDFDSHWDMVDEFPESKDAENKPLASDRAKAVQNLEAHWELPEDSPQPERSSIARPNPRHNQPSWSIGDEE